jgi:hypothetical protein
MNINRIMPRLLVATIGFFSACAVTADMPEWINNNPVKYPNTLYLVGRGAGSTAEEAQNRARGDLASIFEVHIRMINENSLSVTQSGKNEQVDKQSRQQVSARTDKTINGITIAELWRDPVTTDFHALAVLSRAQAAGNLQEELAKADADIKLQMEAAQSAKDPLLEIAALNRALNAAQQRDGLQQLLKVIDPSGQGLEAPVSSAAIEAQCNDVLEHMLITSDVVESGGLEEFSVLLKGALAAAGFLAVSPEKADFVLSGKLKLKELAPKNNWHWMRATVEISLVDRATGRVRGSKTWLIKVSAQDARTLDSRALIEIEKRLKAELRAAIFEFAAG